MKVIKKLKSIGFQSMILSSLDFAYTYLLYKKYNFDKWHLSAPKYSRTYRDVIITTVNQNQNLKNCVEIGCGLGHIIGHIKADKTYGIDLCSKVIEAATFYYRKRRHLSFLSGGFETLRDLPEDDIDALILPNIIFDYDANRIYETVSNLYQYKPFKMFIFDSYRQSPDFFEQLKDCFGDISYYDDGGDGDRRIFVLSLEEFSLVTKEEVVLSE